MEYSAKVPVPLSVVITKEGKWFVAACPVLDIATQGKDEKEVIENMKDLVEEYFEDPDTQKPTIQSIMSSSVSVINIPVKMEISNVEA